MNEKTKVLVVDDELPIRRYLKASLPTGDFDVIEAETAEAGIRMLATKNPDLVLLDLGLPDKDGLDVVSEVREWSKTPIIVLSARGQEQDKVTALENGADDYLTKPFGLAELIARINVALRHANSGQTESEMPVVEFGSIKVDLPARLVYKDGEELTLTPIEFKLLRELVLHAGKVLTHKHLLHEVWGPAYEEETHYLRVYMGQLRHKLEPVPSSPKYLLTESGVGYRLKIE